MYNIIQCNLCLSLFYIICKRLRAHAAVCASPRARRPCVRQSLTYGGKMKLKNRRLLTVIFTLAFCLSAFSASTFNFHIKGPAPANVRKPSPNTHVRVLLLFLLCRRICGRRIGDNLQQGVFLGDNDAVVCVVTVVLLTLTTPASLVLALVMVLFLAAITAGKQKKGEKCRTSRNNKRFLFHRDQRYLTNTAECRFCSSSAHLPRFCLKKKRNRSRKTNHGNASLLSFKAFSLLKITRVSARKCGAEAAR